MKVMKEMVITLLVSLSDFSSDGLRDVSTDSMQSYGSDGVHTGWDNLLDCHANGFGAKFPQETDIFLSVTNDANRNRAALAEGHEDEFDAIFDIIDNFGISIEEGLVFFEKASEWLATRARDEARRMLLTRPRKDEEQSVEVQRPLLEGDLLSVNPTLRAGTPLKEHSMPSVIRDRITVASEDYLQGKFLVDR